MLCHPVCANAGVIVKAAARDSLSKMRIPPPFTGNRESD